MSTSEVRVSNRKGRPNYPLAYKREVAMAACAPNVSVAKVALAHGLNTNMVFKWRRERNAPACTVLTAWAQQSIHN